MKSLPLQSQHYRYLLQSYKEYLQVTGYAETTWQSWPVHVREFLHYIESKKIEHITAIETNHINDFIQHIKRRSSNRITKGGTASAVALCGGGLSSSSINKIINGVNVFAKFLNSTGSYFFELTAQRAETDVAERNILTIAEIKQLYEASFLPYEWNNAAMGQRDRAIIALYYGCGLRRSEGVQLNITDIDLQRRLLFVRKAKGNKQRYVPIAAKHVEDISDYLQQGREWFLCYHNNNTEWHNQHKGTLLLKKTAPLNGTLEMAGDAFLVTHWGSRFFTPEYRIKYLQRKAEIEKPVTLHGLRHSIATHLLQSGMEIEEIAKFLGHASLASTQIYTHIINEL